MSKQITIETQSSLTKAKGKTTRINKAGIRYSYVTDVILWLCFHSCLLLLQWGGLLFHLCLGADGHRDHLVCCQWQCGEADVWTTGKQTAVQGAGHKLSSFLNPLIFFFCSASVCLGESFIWAVRCYITDNTAALCWWKCICVSLYACRSSTRHSWSILRRRTSFLGCCFRILTLTWLWGACTGSMPAAHTVLTVHKVHSFLIWTDFPCLFSAPKRCYFLLSRLSVCNDTVFVS